MKNLVAIFLLSGFVAGISSCHKINEATQFTLNYSTSLAVPSASIIVATTQDFMTDEMETGTADKFKSAGTSKDLVDEITMTEFKMTADTGNLDYLNSVSIYIRGTGLADELVAHRDNIQKGQTSIKLEMTGANIKEHLFKDKIRYRATIAFNATNTKSQNLKLDQALLVKAKLLK